MKIKCTACCEEFPVMKGFDGVLWVEPHHCEAVNKLPDAIYLKHGKDHYLPTADGDMVKIHFIKELKKPAVLNQDFDTLPRMDRIMRYGNI